LRDRFLSVTAFTRWQTIGPPAEKKLVFLFSCADYIRPATRRRRIDPAVFEKAPVRGRRYGKALELLQFQGFAVARKEGFELVKAAFY